jgi:hypothetical protein
VNRHFFIAGAQRSATTYLYHLLAEHPEIEMAEPVRPEPKFFIKDELYSQGRDYYEGCYFGRQPGAWLRGEKSTTYIESEVAAARISAWYPHATIIVMLRDPVERAVSNYWFSVNNGLETLGMEEAFRSEETRRGNYDRSAVSTSPFAYLARGRYIDYLDLYLRYFPVEQIEILLNERFVGDAEAVRGLYRRLGVADYIPANLNQVVNESEKGDAGLPPELRAALAAYFAEPNRKLAARFGLDLSCWRSYSG